MTPPQGTVTPLDQIKRFEVTEVYAHPESNVDIVLVHGLNGHPRNTWTAKNGVFWPNQLLPVTLKNAKARVLVYGYNADVYAFGNDRSASTDMIHQHAQTMISSLAMERMSEEKEENAIIWVVHSLGGILVKRALELSNDLTSKSSDPMRSIYVSTFGIIFLGTPHLGADPAKWGLILEALVHTIMPKKVVDTEDQLVKTLKSNNETLQNINLHFLDIYQRFEIDMVHEAVKTDLKAMKAFVVDQASASPPLPGVRYYGIEATHSNMCKFESKNAPGYLNVSTAIKGWVSDCPPRMEARWVAEKKARRLAKENEARELLGIFDRPETTQSKLESSANTPALSNSEVISTSMIHSVASIEPDLDPLDNSSKLSLSAPLFIKPPGFRPNSLFVGRETELADMHRMLFDKKRRAEGVSAVLLQSLPGGGKTHLARQYVYTHLHDFPGGIFWVRAKSQEQLEAGFWDIATRVAFKPDDKLDCRDFIRAVCEWFSTHHNWLLVLDGIQFEHSDELRQFIPDSMDSSMIYTSTEGNVGGDHHFMNPQVIRIPLLSAREAQELFLLELEKSHPTQDDRLNSMELVRRMGFLPLVIHAVAQRLKATQEPLREFVRKYGNRPRLGELDTYVTIAEQLKEQKAFEALDLISTVCFFSQHIPVEMIALGLRAIDINLKSYEPGIGRSLNNTFVILNRYALIDRSGQEDAVQSSQASTVSKESLVERDNVDVIRLHSVVQDFFIDSIYKRDMTAQWLRRAINLFTCSYERGTSKIKGKTNAGLVADYRNYEIHGSRLLGHLDRLEKKHPVLPEQRKALEYAQQDIQAEIDRRTRDSSTEFVKDRSGRPQASIFDRTSSSSDTGPDTPGLFDPTSTWGTDGKLQLESPQSMHDAFHIIDLRKSHFPSMPDNDIGYDTDRDELPIMKDVSHRTARPTSTTIASNTSNKSTTAHNSPNLEGNEWQVFRRKPHSSRSSLHRTTRTMENHRYHDTAGSWRAVYPSASDPRVMHEIAHGSMTPINASESRPMSRGRLSGHSTAEVALTQISKTSPPPGRGGGFIQDRGRSAHRATKSEDSASLIASATRPAYSQPTASDSPMTATYQGPSLPIPISASSKPNSQDGSITPAVQSLQKLPHGYFHAMDSPMSSGPGFIYQQPYPNSSTNLSHMPLHPGASDSNLQPYHLPAQSAHPYPDSGLEPPLYPRQGGPLPIEYTAGASSPLKRDHPHSPPLSPIPYHSFPATKCLVQGEGPYSQLLGSSLHPNGYSSQPMSRDPSGQSSGSNRSHSSLGEDVGRGVGSRRPSFAETEPAPDLPAFSPTIKPTSYQVYETAMQRNDSGRVRKSPRLGFSSLAGDDGAGWGSPVSLQRTFNPHAPIFQPESPRKAGRGQVGGLMLVSPLLPFAKIYNDGGNVAMSPPVPTLQPVRTADIGGGGGVLIGRRIIEFGDLPEGVDWVERRARADRERAERIAREDRARRGL